MSATVRACPQNNLVLLGAIVVMSTIPPRYSRFLTSVVVVTRSVRNEGGQGVKSPYNCTGPSHLCFSRGPRVGP